MTVAGRSSSRPATPFRWTSRAAARLLRWEVTTEWTLFGRYVPAKATDGPVPVPELIVSHVRGRRRDEESA